MKVIDLNPGTPNVIKIDSDSQRPTSISSSIGPISANLYLAGEPILAGQAIALVAGRARRYDVGDRTHAYRLIGIALTSALTNTPITVADGPSVSIVGWGLIPGATYRAGRAGQLMIGTADPDAVFSQVIGRATSTTELVYNPQLVILS